MTTTLTIEELEQSGERELGTSEWHEITQEQINCSPRQPATTSGSTSIPKLPRTARSGPPSLTGT